MNELSLFSGAGGGLLATHHLLGWRTVGYVEIDEYCQRVLRARIKDGLLDDAPIFPDVRTFDGRPYRGKVDCITAGFPCQPFSAAGQRRGKDDKRNMWPDTIRVIREVEPQFCFLENVPGLLNCGYFSVILGDLADSGLDVAWTVLSAADCGAPHIRKRLWILAYPSGLRRQQISRGSLSYESQNERGHSQENYISKCNGESRESRNVADSDRERKLRNAAPRFEGGNGTGNGGWWNAEPNVGRVANGVAAVLDGSKSITKEQLE